MFRSPGARAVEQQLRVSMGEIVITDLDGSLVRSKRLERSNREIAERLDAAIGTIREVLKAEARVENGEDHPEGFAEALMDDGDEDGEAEDDEE